MKWVMMGMKKFKLSYFYICPDTDTAAFKTNNAWLIVNTGTVYQGFSVVHCVLGALPDSYAHTALSFVFSTVVPTLLLIIMILVAFRNSSPRLTRTATG